MSNCYKFALSGNDSGGKACILDAMAFAGAEMPRHIHTGDDEIFTLVSGSCEFWLGDKYVTPGLGEPLHIRRGVEHGFRITGDGPARYVMILSPGASEGFFRAMGDTGLTFEDDGARIEAIAAHHQMQFTGMAPAPLS
ncbi:cupin domain-containing protein [Sulfitobacter sabulilitoris]|uniref:Cupin domain-containing protein n=2 Tax=Sulfitobacter sabulilitoris TaxID=2562655 RepID=A0A5S3PGW5_9RHOB|nr:cupin domain-containing protein [Sulfitobacter sabulilitoris]